MSTAGIIGAGRLGGDGAPGVACRARRRDRQQPRITLIRL
jgi:hypothetical protein